MASAIRQVQQAFLQIVMSRRVLRKDAAEDLLNKTAETFGVANSAPGLSECLHKLNEKLQAFHLEVRGMNVANGEWIVLVNKSNDDVAKKFASRIKEWEQEYFKAIIQKLCEGDNKPVHVDDLLKVRFEGQVPSGLNDMDRDLFLKFLETEAWTQRDKHGQISLAPRALVELREVVIAHGMEVPQVIYY